MKQLPLRWKYDRIFSVEQKSGSRAFIPVQILVYGLRLLENCEFFFHHFRAIIGCLQKLFKKRVNIKLNSTLVLPFTKKSVSARMGKGKGIRKGFKALGMKGMILLEVSNITASEAKIGLQQCGVKVPGKSKIVKFQF